MSFMGALTFLLSRDTITRHKGNLYILNPLRDVTNMSYLNSYSQSEN